MPKLTIPNPLDDGQTKLQVVFRVIRPTQFNNDDYEFDYEEDEIDDIQIRRIYQIDKSGKKDVSEFWSRHPSLEEVEEEVIAQYAIRAMEVD